MSFAAVVAVLSLSASLPNLHVDGPYFKDDHGGVVVLRGLNVAGNAKVPPFVGLTGEEQLLPMQAWGMNVMRLLFTWEAYEPQPGVYNETYLDTLAGLIEHAEQLGIYTLLDFHQDGMARTLIGGCGEGFPTWAIPSSVPQVPPDNGPVCRHWGMRMLLDKDLKAAWHGFHSDEEGARTRFVAMVGHVAERLQGVPGLIGYDLVNEPLGDEPTELASLYADAAAAVGGADPNAILFLEPHATVAAGLQTTLERPAFANVVYAPHYYDSMVITTGVWLGKMLIPPFQKMLAKAGAWQAPLFVGEFGARANTWRVRAYMDMLYRHLDDGFISGTQWGYTPGWTAQAKDGWNDEDFSVVDDTGALRANFKPRAYAQRIAGTPVHMRVQQTERKRLVELTWVHDPSAGQTRIYVPSELFAGRSSSLSLKGDGLNCAQSEQTVTCGSPQAGTKTLRLE